MKVHIHIVNEQNVLISKILFSNNKASTIQIDEYNYIDFEIECETEDNLSIIYIGNTPFPLDEPFIFEKAKFYRINLNYIQKQLPGNDSAHLTKKTYKTNSGERKFTRLFLNEIGESPISIKKNDSIIEIGIINVSTSKLSNENYILITNYLFYNRYFEHSILYKTYLDGEQNDIIISLLEAIRKLVYLLEEFSLQLHKFSDDPICNDIKNEIVVSYNKTTIIDDSTISWLIDNVDSISKVKRYSRNQDFSINGISYVIEEIMTNNVAKNYNSYENRIIHGFLSSLVQILIDYKSILTNQSILKSRISNFRDFILKCYNDQILLFIDKGINKSKYIQKFFINKLPVIQPLTEFPKKIDYFLSKQHYKNALDIIKYSRNIFSFDINTSDVNLEIESFDKLFEVYVFYLIKDSLELLIGLNDWEYNSNNSKNNRLSGVYVIKNENKIIKLYYEKAPEKIKQLSKSKYDYLPDFFIEFSNQEVTNILIFDAKYKLYSNERLNEDFSKLTLNYLHKIGFSPTTNNTNIKGLYLVSLNTSNNYNSIFSDKYNFFSNNPVYPDIANIGIEVETFDLNNSYFSSILKNILDDM